MCDVGFQLRRIDTVDMKRQRLLCNTTFSVTVHMRLAAIVTCWTRLCRGSMAAEQVDPTTARSHGSGTTAESCAPGAGPAATADGGDLAAAATAAGADANAAAGSRKVHHPTTAGTNVRGFADVDTLSRGDDLWQTWSQDRRVRNERRLGGTVECSRGVESEASRRSWKTTSLLMRTEKVDQRQQGNVQRIGAIHEF